MFNLENTTNSCVNYDLSWLALHYLDEEEQSRNRYETSFSFTFNVESPLQKEDSQEEAWTTEIVTRENCSPELTPTSEAMNQNEPRELVPSTGGHQSSQNDNIVLEQSSKTTLQTARSSMSDVNRKQLEVKGKRRDVILKNILRKCRKYYQKELKRITNYLR